MDEPHSIMKRLAGKTALVTGGASGLGKAIAVRLQTEGAVVAISDRQAELGQTTAAAGGFLFLEHDVCDESRWSEVVREIEQRCGKLDVLVNNAGIVGGPQDSINPQSTTLENWRRVFAVNVEGVFLGCRAALPAMHRAGGGSIVNISSVAGLLATPYNAAYGASKAAVWQFTKSVAEHCALVDPTIRCNSVHPGDVHTPLWDRLAEEVAQARGVSVEAVLAEAQKTSPLGGFTLPEDVASAVAYLASDESRRITGSQVMVDGGLIGCDTFHMVRSSGLYK
jgi:3(or 17)beta-hydroxysteroid dehydrogenase